jgi:hypothetical protein
VEQRYTKYYLENKIISLNFAIQSTFIMENNSSSAEDLKTIRKIMEESSRFLSLSGLSGIFAGSFAIIGALVAWLFILDKGIAIQGINETTMLAGSLPVMRIQLLAIALTVLLLSVSVSLALSAKKARKAGKNIWTPVSKRLLINFLVPLATGGFLIIIFLIRDEIQLISPGMLIFYGLALVNAGKFTYGEIFYLGLLQIVTGLLAAVFPQWGFWLWVFGFGLLHIVYGFVMYRKYEA